jgi:hypothetical protein
MVGNVSWGWDTLGGRCGTCGRLQRVYTVPSTSEINHKMLQNAYAFSDTV